MSEGERFVERQLHTVDGRDDAFFGLGHGRRIVFDFAPQGFEGRLLSRDDDDAIAGLPTGHRLIERDVRGGSECKTVTVHETEYKLNPSNISLTKPGTYVFKGVNDGTTTHALAVEGNGLDQDGMHISPGSSGTLKVTLSKAGTYQIYCPVGGHKDLGMKGTITVGGSSSGGTSTEGTTTSSGSGY
jgi:plastocyanin